MSTDQLPTADEELMAPLTDEELGDLLMAAYPEEFPEADHTARDRALEMADYIFDLPALRDLLGRVCYVVTKTTLMTLAECGATLQPTTHEGPTQ